MMYGMYVFQHHHTTLLLLQMIPWHLIWVPLHQAIMLAKEAHPDQLQEHKTRRKGMQTPQPKTT